MRHKYFEGIWEAEDLILYNDKPIAFHFEREEPTRELLEIGFLNEVSKFHSEIQ